MSAGYSDTGMGRPRGQGSGRRLRGFVCDAGALIALERRSAFMIGIWNEALHGTTEVVLPRTVIAQVWRGMARRANWFTCEGYGRRPDISWNTAAEVRS
jgi:hypothetical protein